MRSTGKAQDCAEDRTRLVPRDVPCRWNRHWPQASHLARVGFRTITEGEVLLMNSDKPASLLIALRPSLIVSFKRTPRPILDFRMNAQTPAQIFRSLKRLPALQLDEAVASRYAGLRVYWKTRFFLALDINQGSVKQFSFMQRGWHRFSRLDHPIYCHIDISQYPETRSLRRGRRVDLYGRITDVDIVLGIKLALDRFEILPLTLLDRFVVYQDSRI
jgi:hypothetical protein